MTLAPLAPGRVTTDQIRRRQVQRIEIDRSKPLAAYMRISKADLVYSPLEQLDLARMSEEEREQRDRAAIDRQREDIELLAGDEGVTVGDWYEDINLSASDPDIYRPGFERMLKDLEAGKWGGIIVYHSDRLQRRNDDGERILKLYERNPQMPFFSVEGYIDLSTEQGRDHYREKVKDAKNQSVATSRRIARQNATRAVMGGRPAGRTPMWLNTDGTLKPDIAPILREAIDMALRPEGGGAVAISDFLWENGIGTTPNRNHKTGVKLQTRPLGPMAVYYLLTNPALCGIVKYKGEWVCDPATGEPIEGWIKDSLIPREKWEQLQAAMARRRLKQTRPRSTYLLTGILRCGLCNTKMVGHATQSTSRRTGEKTTIRGYFCAPANRGCGKCHRKADPLEDHVVKYVIDYAATHRVGQLGETVDTPEEWTGRAELEKTLRFIKGLDDRYGAMRIEPVRYFEMLEPLEAKRDALIKERDQFARRVMPVEPIDPEVIARFQDANAARQYALISRLVTAVVVQPGIRGKRSFDKSRVEIVPRTAYPTT